MTAPGMSKTTNKKVRCVVIGAGGYSGAELIDLLLDHPHAQVVGLFASAKRGETGKPSRLADIFPRFAKRTDLEVLPTDLDAVAALKPDVVFLATPNEASYELGDALIARGLNVIDLSGAFRLKDTAQYPKHYGFEHKRQDLLDQAIYGLPELYRKEIADAQLIANPGCYPTSAILPLAPLVKAGLLEKDRRPIVDAISGVSGAGRAADLRTHFCEVSVQPYNVLKHRHNPEIDQYAGTPVVFTPHLGPYDRGILSTIHVDLHNGFTAQQIGQIMHAAYDNEPFVRLLPAGQWPSVAAVRGTNYCDIAWAVDEANGHLILCSAIDNLVKGAAGQAVQCMNVRFDLPETSGLLKETT